MFDFKAARMEELMDTPDFKKHNSKGGQSLIMNSNWINKEVIEQ